MIAPDAYLLLAEKLVTGMTEEEWRSAVSRAYYAAFHGASEFMGALGFQVPQSEEAHIYLSRRLSNSGDPTLSRAGRELSVLRSDRNLVDYNFRCNLTVSTARLQVQSAREIMEILDDCTLEPPRTQVRDAMRDYEANVLKDITWQGP
jgi:uncharacterized protein (UPF0332 family)